MTPFWIRSAVASLLGSSMLHVAALGRGTTVHAHRVQQPKRC